MKPLIKITRFNHEDVIAGDQIIFNHNNIWEEGKRPDDYLELSDKFETKHWVDLFHKDYKVLDLEEIDVKWLIDASNTSILDVRRNLNRFYDEIQSSLKKYKLPESDKGWFIRTEKYSFKNTLNGAGPYKNMIKVIESMATYARGHEPMHETYPQDKRIYLFPWINIDRDKEFRIFVLENKIVGISQQHLYEPNKWLNSKKDSDIESLVIKINVYFEDFIKPKLMFYCNYVMDLALIGEEEIPYFIEPNQYGKEYGAGSSLFNWINDRDRLEYGREENIEIRFCDQ